MNKLYKGSAGSGKTTKLLDQALTLIKDNDLLPSDILILTLTTQGKEELDKRRDQIDDNLSLNIQFIDTFAKSIISKSLKYMYYKQVEDDQGIQIIQFLSKKEFIKSSNMLSLTKSNKFSRELYNLFGLFKSYDISDKSFFVSWPDLKIIRKIIVLIV
ncbi:MAG: UvrD-helicase domain-containing protein [Cyanobacteriota bacterium]